jgi:hypothetical protein
LEALKGGMGVFWEGEMKNSVLGGENSIFKGVELESSQLSACSLCFKAQL